MTDTLPPLPKLNSILMAREGRMLRITFNRPDQLNACCPELVPHVVERLCTCSAHCVDDQDCPARKRNRIFFHRHASG